MPTPTIRYNSKGAKVADLQRRLLALGYNPGPVDGVFGRRTLYAVKAFQAQAVGQRGLGKKPFEDRPSKTEV